MKILDLKMYFSQGREIEFSLNGHNYFLQPLYDDNENKYVLYDKVDQSRTYYEYMKIDLRDGYAWVDYNSDTTNTHTEIRFPQEKDGSYYVQIETVDEKGNRKNETVYAKP